MLQLQLSKSIAGNVFVEFQTTVKGIGIEVGDLITVTYLKEGLERQPFRVVKMAPGQNYQTVQVTAQWHDDGWYTTGAAGTAGGSPAGSAAAGLPRPLVGSVLDSHGIEQFGITRDGHATFGRGIRGDTDGVVRSAGEAGGVGREYSTAEFESRGEHDGRDDRGGADAVLRGKRVGRDGRGERTVVCRSMAVIPSGGNTNSVSLTGLSFSAGDGGVQCLSRGESV